MTVGSSSLQHFLTKSPLCKANCAASVRQVLAKVQLDTESRCWKINASAIAGSDDSLRELADGVLAVALGLAGVEAIVCLLDVDGEHLGGWNVFVSASGSHTRPTFVLHVSGSPAFRTDLKTAQKAAHLKNAQPLQKTPFSV